MVGFLLSITHTKEQNKTTNIQKLLKEIMENSKTLVRKCYTNEMYQEAERNTLTMEEKTMKEREEILKENISINA